jgi:hypothetical protein
LERILFVLLALAALISSPSDACLQAAVDCCLLCLHSPLRSLAYPG